MGKIRLNVLFQLLLGLMLLLPTACDTSISTDEAVIADAVERKKLVEPTDTYVVDTTKSEVTWIGAKMTGRHNGVFRIKSGELHMSNGMLTGGNFLLDVANTVSADKTIDAESNRKLTTHLRSPDFFDVEKYPTAEFELTEISPIDSKEDQKVAKTSSKSEMRVPNPTHRIMGNLTIKGETKSVTFPARITIDSTLRAKANFNIDRTKWGLIYRSDKSLGDKTIRPEVNIGIDLVATPQAN